VRLASIIEGGAPVKIKKKRTYLQKRAARGYRGDPIATIAYYGPDDRRATKVAVGIVPASGAEPTHMKRWFDEEEDVREDVDIEQEIVDFIQEHGVHSVVITDGILGCPHEEGIDYPEGEQCPRCPFWHDRDRFLGRYLH